MQFAGEVLPAAAVECTGHCVHALSWSALRKYPATHEHAPNASLPAGAVESAGQGVHTLASVAPTTTEYIFARHFSHAAALFTLGLYVPAGHDLSLIHI